MEISIGMATYNGEKYIIDQLDSLRKQTLQADEIVIVDDCSDDNTVSIINQYIQKYNLTKWVLRVNDQNLGWRETFYRIINLVNGEILFFCDQDDIWHRNKVEIMTRVLTENREVKILASNYNPFFEESYKDRQKKYLRKHRQKNDGNLIKIENTYKNFHHGTVGCCLAFKTELIPRFNDAWFVNYRNGHDSALWKIGVASECLYVLRTPLIEFRKHTNSSIAKEIAEGYIIQVEEIVKNDVIFEKNMESYPDFYPSIFRYRKLDELRLSGITKRALFKTIYWGILTRDFKTMIKDILIYVT